MSLRSGPAGRVPVGPVGPVPVGPVGPVGLVPVGPVRFQSVQSVQSVRFRSVWSGSSRSSRSSRSGSGRSCLVLVGPVPVGPLFYMSNCRVKNAALGNPCPILSCRLSVLCCPGLSHPSKVILGMLGKAFRYYKYSTFLASIYFKIRLNNHEKSLKRCTRSIPNMARNPSQEAPNELRQATFFVLGR